MIPPEELAQLAALYDRFANHLDPLGGGWKRCRQEYLDALVELHERHAARFRSRNFVAKRSVRAFSGCGRRTSQPRQRRARELAMDADRFGSTRNGPIKFNLPEAEAVERLVDLTREHGTWIEPEVQPVA